MRAPAQAWPRLITRRPRRPPADRWAAVAAETVTEETAAKETATKQTGEADGRVPGSRAQAGADGRAAGARAHAAESGPRPDEQDGERYPADGYYARLLPGLLPGGSFLPAGDVVVMDVETTGWLADAAGITEIGAVRLSPGFPPAEFSALVNPGRPIPPGITDLTGITDAMVSDAPTIAQVLPTFLEFASGCVIVAHNAPFDLGFLAAACDQCGIEWPHQAVIDTAVLSRLLLGAGAVPDHRLATLSAHFDVTAGPRHRALADAKATAAVLRGLLGLLTGGPAVPTCPPRYRPPAAATAVPGPDAAPNRYDDAAAGSTRVPGVTPPGQHSAGIGGSLPRASTTPVPGGRSPGPTQRGILRVRRRLWSPRLF